MKKIAIVVGNDSYEKPYNSLSHAIKDAQKVAGFLEHRLGFKTLFLANPTAAEVELALLRVAPDFDDPDAEDAEYRLEDDSIFFFYFAGHGLCVGGAPGQSLLCRDANKLLVKGVAGASGAVSPDTMSAISRAGRGYMFFCYDVCRTAGRAGSAPQEGGKGLRDATAYPKDANGNRSALRGARLTLSSCADGCQANDDGAFATALVEEMTRLLNAGREIRLDQTLVDRVATKLDLDQRPELAGTPFTLVPGIIVDPQPVETAFELTKQAEVELKAGRCKEAEQLANKALRLDPYFSWATYVLTETRKQLEKGRRRAGDRMTLNIKGVEYAFRWIPAGSFMMGEENTWHKVNISQGFWMLESPITQGMWKSIMRNNPSYFKGSDYLPVEQISWNDCQKYIERLNRLGDCLDGFKFSLPTEAEWEYACRAGTTTPYWFGNSLNGDKANCNGNYPFGTDEKGPFLMKTTEVGKYPANAWGLFDMHGNVWEWCLDWFGDPPADEVTDPKGAERGACRVDRGGSWALDAINCLSAYSCGAGPDYRSSDLGARLVLHSLV